MQIKMKDMGGSIKITWLEIAVAKLKHKWTGKNIYDYAFEQYEQYLKDIRKDLRKQLRCR